ncbi:MAG: pirin family protein [Burkholderiaceae bacterium]
MTARALIHKIPAQQTSDGAGVRLHRSLGSQQMRVDPFLMLDEFSTENPDDYIAGFPPHPHRGFETVTYMLEGHMLHEDHLGNKGHLRSGDVQWMTAGRGIIHSEMPQQEQGAMRGFQLWINLPAAEKMKPASYRDIPSAEIPVVALAGGIRVKVIAGQFVAPSDTSGDTSSDSSSDASGDAPGAARAVAQKTTTGPIHGISTQPLFLDVTVPADGAFSQALPKGHSCFVYVFEGAIDLPGGALGVKTGGVLGPGEALEVRAQAAGARFLVLAARPLKEPVVQYGPFVMNTRQEIEQAIADYQSGRLVA